ncbi:uncharacterized protein BJ171DRAFT_524307 [Polychytrium aggregatum]|uniref:uncharacterized protein n=1 Tax=Polychytrium aggregatum TaxID=110093 RepID=UPI0022FEFB1A|nr:uncharacterized protein BJ171DRAFT_524307 [Polychytrium aggregatum]KAI9193714.1 hypothetical protein BJ171DRAFT_524307 [Polychytrium aggregatum]
METTGAAATPPEPAGASSPTQDRSEDVAAEAQENLCEVCHATASKYKCPGCLCKTCSLPCSREHKTLTGCDGKRNRTVYVPMSEYNEDNMMSDYCLLEEIARVTDNAVRDQAGAVLRPRLPFRYQLMLKGAKSRRMFIRFLSAGMRRHESNLSKFNTRFNSFSWTIEWLFVDCDHRIIQHRVRETSTFADLLKQHLGESGKDNALQRYKLKLYCEAGLENLRIFMRRVDVPANTPQFYLADASLTVQQFLTGKHLIEYPTLLVYASSLAVPGTIVSGEPSPAPGGYVLDRWASVVNGADQPLEDTDEAAEEGELDESEGEQATVDTDHNGTTEPVAGADAGSAVELDPQGLSRALMSDLGAHACE